MAGRRGRPAVGSSQRATGPTDRRAADSGSPVGRTADVTGSDGRRLPPFTRPALAPGLIAAIVLVACIAIADAPAFVYARWGITVLALIVLVFAVRGRAWWAVVLMAAVAVLWNPVVPVALPDLLWSAMQIVAAAAFVATGLFVKVPRQADA